MQKYDFAPTREWVTFNLAEVLGINHTFKEKRLVGYDCHSDLNVQKLEDISLSPCQDMNRELIHIFSC